MGKSRLTQKVKDDHASAVTFAEVSFGIIEGIDTPINLMAKLYEQIAPKDSWSDSFWAAYELYWETIHQLKTESSTGRGAASEEQQQAVEQLLKLGVDVAGIFLSEPSKKIVESVAERGMQAAVATLSIKDGLQQHLQQHKATKRDKQLQDLMLDPLPRLTEAFAEGLRRQAQTKPIVLILDTYEKVSSDLDLWLWRTLLGNQPLQPHAVRLLVAGRHCVLKTEGWRKLNQDRHLIYEQTMRKFNASQTQDYLEAIDITDDPKVQQIYRITKGLPYYLNWIREETAKGNEPDFSQGNEEIVNLLLQGLNDTQKRIVQYAACCRSFDRKLIQHLVECNGLDFATAADEELNCFGWLVKRSYVELASGRYRLDDVARDVFRLSLYQDDRELFHQTHQRLADYAKAESDDEVPPESPYPARYNNPDWRRLRADYLYHLMFSRNTKKSQHQFRTHLLEARYFRQDEVVQSPLNAIAAEVELNEHPLLSYTDCQFLVQIRPAVEHGWAVLEEDPIDYPYNLDNYTLSKQATDQAIWVCLQTPETLDGLAKFAALFYQARRCSEDQAYGWIQQARSQAETLVNLDDPHFSSSLLLWKIGATLYKNHQYAEALEAFNRAIEIKSENPEAYIYQGNSLSALGRKEAAIESYDKAIAIKPDDHGA